MLNDSPDHNQVERVQHLIERLDEGPYLHSRSLPSRYGVTCILLFQGIHILKIRKIGTPKRGSVIVMKMEQLSFTMQ